MAPSGSSLLASPLTIVCRASSFLTLPVAHIPPGEVLAAQMQLLEDATFLMLLVFGLFVPWFFILKFDYDPRYRLVNLLFCDLVATMAWALAFCQNFPFSNVVYMGLVAVPLASYIRLVAAHFRQLKLLKYPTHVIVDAIPLQDERGIHYLQLICIMVEVLCLEKGHPMVVLSLVYTFLLTAALLAWPQLQWGPELRLINLLGCINGHYGTRLIEGNTGGGPQKLITFYCSILAVFLSYRLVFKDVLRVAGLLDDDNGTTPLKPPRKREEKFLDDYEIIDPSVAP